jgi:hypothetical protein
MAITQEHLAVFVVAMVGIALGKRSGVFAKKYQDELMAVYWGREDDAIHVITTLRHYLHKIASENEDTLEFVSSVGDGIVVALTDEERRQLERAG